jgi:hypothetical protein
MSASVALGDTRLGTPAAFRKRKRALRLATQRPF